MVPFEKEFLGYILSRYQTFGAIVQLEFIAIILQKEFCLRITYSTLGVLAKTSW